MPILSDTSLRTRLILAFLALVIVMSTSTYLSINFSQNASQEMRVIVEDQTRRALLAQRAAKRVQIATVQLLTLLQTEERRNRIPLYRAMDEALRGADAAVRTLSKELNTPAISRFIELRNMYADRFQATVEEIEFNGLAAARAHFAEHTQPVLNQLLEEAEAVSITQQDAMAASQQVYREKSAALSSMIVLIELIIVCLALAFSYLFARSIAALLKEPVRVADRIASGDYTTEIPSARSPELGRLLRALEHMRAGILGRERHIKRLAFEDRLTGLGSRLKFMQELESAVTAPVANLVLVDINRFAQINKALGHHLGDEALTKVARRLETLSAERFSLCRVESNRFGMVLTNESSDETRAVVNAILAAFEQPIDVSNQKIYIDLRAAIVDAGLSDQSPEALLRSAEQALEAARQHFKSCIEVKEVPPPSETESLTLLGELRTALQEGQFELVYQPKWCSANERVTAVEALIRWHHPERGYVRPDLFIPFCEQTGFIRQITPWVVTEAMNAAKRWQQTGVDLVVAVNLSTLDLDNPALEAHLRAELQRTGIAPGSICLEVTESALMSDPDSAQAYLERLRSMGFKLAIDDYGTGQASLAYVRDLPVQELKIDRSFITHVDSEPRTAAIVRSTLKLCQELGISQVAEGVETKEELNWLRQENCSMIQGFLISKPLAEADLLEMVTQARAS